MSKDYSLPTIVEKECLRCNTIFKVKRKEIWAGRGKYCSIKCAREGQGIIRELNKNKYRVEKQCEICKKFIYVKKSHKDIAGTYCSEKCMSIAYKEKLKGKNNPNFKNKNSGSKEYRKKHSQVRRAIRKKVYSKLETDEILNILKTKKCYWCNKTIKKDKCLDHYIPLAKGGKNTIENIVVSCRSCNAKKHAKDPLQFANENGRLL